MSDFKNNNFSNANFSNNKGNIVIGDDNATLNSVSFSSLEEVTDNLIKDIMDSDLPSDNKEQVSESIQQVVEQVKSDKPNKLIVKSLLAGIPTALSVAANATKLMESFGNWKIPIMQLLGLQ